MERVEKQTAVEWLVEMLVQECGLDDTGDSAIFVIEQAKAIVRGQIETAFEEGMFHHTSGLCPDEYYEETFKSE